MDDQTALALLKEVLRIPSVNGNEKEVADYLEKVLQSHDIETEQVKYAEGRHQLIARLGGGNQKVLGFTGHMDVVPVGEIPWKHDPFGAEEEDGKLFGRGSTDMKAGLVGQIVAMIRLKEASVPLSGQIKLLATAGEETSAIGAEQLVAEKHGDDLDGLIIGEPTGLNVVIAHKGAFWLRITTFGRTAHGSMPEMGVNAVEHMVKFLHAFQEKFHFELNIDELVGHSTASINIINGGNGTNVVPDKCTVEIDIRTIVTQKHEDILAEVKQLVDEVTNKTPKFHAEIEVINDLPSVHTDQADPFVGLVQKAAQKIVPSSEIKGGSYYTDGSRFTKSAKKFPIIVLGPGENDQAHQPDEFVYIDKFFDSIKVYEEIAKNFLA